MAIGSEAEIGAGFRTEFDSYEERLLWLRDWKERVGPNLLIGYGTLDYPIRGKELCDVHMEVGDDIEPTVADA